MKLTERAERVEPFYAMDVTRRALDLISEGHHVVILSVGEPDFGAPPAVREEMAAAMDGRPLPYCPAMGTLALREAIAAFYGERHGVTVDPSQIIITSGASSALLLVLAATVESGDEVIMADPSYPCNRQLVESFGGRVVSVATSARTRFQLDDASLAAAWSERTAAVMIATPSNPTGTSVAVEELGAMCERARERGAWRIVDEIYLYLSDPSADGTPPQSVLAVDPEAIVINSFSKYFGMTGWRLGWAILPKSLVGPVERLAMNYFLCASVPAQIAALAAFTPESLALCEERRLELLARRALLLEGLERLDLPVAVHPDGAFYAYCDVSGTGLDSWTFCQRALEEARVCLTPGRDFGVATAETHVRISYASSSDEIAEGLRRLGVFLESLRADPRERKPDR
ncbi:MAG TPA: aminotransferase class I/II-fold pyridoxal phosphate-dependent enzyme [Acidimicrobiales bacterium]|nr:aminotransferase class I/II-fold pyridoxal phosphate-dependent enzyme [Acidimicrobiales bacterium]